MGDYSKPQPTHRIVHARVRDAATIHHLVRAIDSITDILAGVRSCGLERNGPVWLTFIHPDGEKVHAWEANICGGLHVNGSRALFDDGRVFDLLTRIVTQAREAASHLEMLNPFRHHLAL